MPGFRQHSHYKQVLEAWLAQGYRVACQGTVDLLDLLPYSRNRFLLILVHKDVPLDAGPEFFKWPCSRKSCLQSESAIFDLPPDIHRLACLSKELLQVYLNPNSFPGRRQLDSCEKVAAHRIVGPSGCVSTFLAQYGYAHELPSELLAAKGLYGSLLHESGITRFFGAPEMASLHGALLPVWCGNDRRELHEAIGNAIATPHAALALHRACQVLHGESGPTAAEVLSFCLSRRVDASSGVFIPFDEGWVLCRDSQVPEVLAGLLPHAAFSVSEGSAKLTVETHFWKVHLRAAEVETQVHCPMTMSPQALLRALGFPASCSGWQPRLPKPPFWISRAYMQGPMVPRRRAPSLLRTHALWSSGSLPFSGSSCRQLPEV